MKAVDLDAIYKANLSTGHLEALEAVYTHGYYSGKGVAVTANTPSIVPVDTAPTTIIQLKHPDLR